MYTIKQVTQQIGVPQDTLRVWERRYGLVKPQRSESGYRLYSEADIALLHSMRRLVSAGMPPSRAAKQLQQANALGGLHGNQIAQSLREDLLTAAVAADESAIVQIIDQVFGLGTFGEVIDLWLSPALRDIGAAWQQDALGVDGEHLVSAAVMRRIGRELDQLPIPQVGPRVVLGLPAGCFHEIPTAALTVLCRQQGLAASFIGANVPANTWQDVSKRAEAIVVSVPTPGDVPSAEEVGRVVSANAKFVVGGPHANSVTGVAAVLPERIVEAPMTIAQILGEKV